MNPNRTCGICPMVEATEDTVARPLPELIALLPEMKEYMISSEAVNGEIFFYPGPSLEDAVKEKFPKLREAAGNCPACMLAALRQRGIPGWAYTFDFQVEKDEIRESYWEMQTTKAAIAGYPSCC